MGKRPRRKRTGGRSAPAKVPEFEEVLGGMSTRARNVLERLGVEDSAGLLAISEEDLDAAWSCGWKTKTEILEAQWKVRPEEERRAREEARAREERELRAAARRRSAFGRVPRAVFEAVKGVFSVRGRRVLDFLNVRSFKDFMALERRELTRCRNCGRKTADEILAVQEGLEEFARELADESGSFAPWDLLAAPCVAGVRQKGRGGMEWRVDTVDVEDPAPWLVGWVRDLARSEEEARAFLLRKGMLGSPPMILAEIAERVGGVTRERARQMDRSLEERASESLQQIRLEPLVEEAADLVRRHGGEVGLEELTGMLLCRGKRGDSLVYAAPLVVFLSTLGVWKKAGLLPARNGVVRMRKDRRRR